MMVEQLIKLLNSKDNLNGWKINEHVRESHELYFIRRDLEMNRTNNVNNIEVTVYQDFEDNGEKYKGSSLTKIHPTMNELEVNDAIDDAIYASQFVKNVYYPLVKPQNMEIGKVITNLSEKPISELMDEIVDAVFLADEYDKGSINSTEIFLTKTNQRIINSEGIDYSYVKYGGAVEFITNWKEDKEEIELFKRIDFGSLDSISITKQVNEMLELSKGRAIATKMPNLGKFDVILSGEDVAKLFSYYLLKGNAAQVYQKISDVQINDNLQGDNIIGDKLSIKLNPFMEGSTSSVPIDNDGIILKEVNLIEEGVLNSYWGDQRFSHYLGIQPTGNIESYEVNCGQKTIDDLKSEPYLEVISFSNFNVDIFTGIFGGEVRFANYYDGNKVIPITGGTISGNINEIQNNMQLSKEQIQINSYKGPKSIKMKDIIVAGN